MRWRDVRFDKPTEADGDENGKVLQRLTTGALSCEPWYDLAYVVAWIPLRELPQPNLADPTPDGWRPVDQAVDAFDARAKFWWDDEWRLTGRDDDWDPAMQYIVPIDPPAPPAPQYRPFASWQEWWPNRGRLYRDAGGCICTAWINVTEAAEDFAGGAVFLNEDGTDAEPYGVKIE